MRVAAAQMAPCTTDLAANSAAAGAALREAALRSAELVVLPELATVPYFCAAPAGAYRHWSVGLEAALSDFATPCHALGIALLLPHFERDADGHCYNSAAMFGADGRQCTGRGLRGPTRVARKLHLPVAGAADETAHFMPGADLAVFDLGTLRLGCLICYDRRFPECWRTLRALGADAVAVPVAGDGGDDDAFFLGEQRTHARENGLGVVCASKVGEERLGGMIVRNRGESCILGADGVIGEEIPALIAAGIRSLKVFLTYDPLHLDDRQFLRVLAAARRHGAFVTVHCENYEAIGWRSEALLAAGLTTPKYHAWSRPAVVEREATYRAIALAELVDQPIQIFHVSCAEVADEIARAQTRGLKVWGETCPQYFTLRAQDMDRPGFAGAKFMCSPSPRDADGYDALWSMLRRGILDVVSSDHSGFSWLRGIGKDRCGIDATVVFAPDVNAMTGTQLEDFIRRIPLPDWQKNELQAAKDRTSYYLDAIA